ncbi:MAG: RelA/SpoT family protein, partial [Candidatus Woesearchaeota archaeon]
LTKISKNNFKNLDDYNSENLRKIILATAKDVRVMFIKLADRLHNMRTLDIHREEKQKRISENTLKIYAPIAEKLGLYKIKSELEDLSFLYTAPEMYEFLSKSIDLTKHEREEKTKHIVADIESILQKNSIHYDIKGRAKHYFSIYKKIVKENKDIKRIYDLYGIRIIVDSEKDCYHVFELLKEQWDIEIDDRTNTPRLKDYIKNPKPNGYRSIHVNFRVEGYVIEVQIRTAEMDFNAESGVAKHWKYKASERDKKLDKKIDLLRQALSWKLNPQNKKAAESYAIDIFGGEIVCITPKGDPIILKEGATPLDFAYAIHTNVGNHFEKAIVNGESALLNQELKSGDIVSIVTAKTQTANKSWLHTVVTSEAKSKLRQALGVTKQTKPKKEVPHEAVEDFKLSQKVEVLGKQYPVKLSKCCNPKFGDDIVGYRSKDKKITVHKKTCPDRFTLPQTSMVEVSWAKEKKQFVEVCIVATDEKGILSDVLSLLLKKNIAVKRVSSENTKKNVIMLLEIPSTSLQSFGTVSKTLKQDTRIIEIKSST